MAFEFSDGMTWAMAAPFVAALVAPAFKRALGHNAAWVLALVPAAIFAYLCGFIHEVAGGAHFVRPEPIAWLPQYGINYSLYIDGLSLVFALLISGIGTCIILYSGGYLKGHPDQGRFFSFMFLFMGSMLGVVLADNVITLFIYWELTSITSFLLIGFNHREERSRRAALQALVVTGGGGLALLAGLILMSIAGNSMEMSILLGSGDALRSAPFYSAMLILVCCGAFTKSAQFPFHFWLKNAMEAPTPVSAFLHSATMVKAGVYLLMRVHPIMGDTALWTSILPVFGGFTLIMGTWMSLRQTDLKQVLAYTTIASLGLMVMLVGTSVEMAVIGAVLYLVAHALFKGGLFMIVGTIDHEAGSRDMTKLAGLKKAMPISFGAAILCALSMGGIWPLLGFVAKEELYSGLIGTDVRAILLTLVAVIGNAMMFAAAFVVAIKPFWGDEVKSVKHAHEGPALMIAGPILLSAMGLVLMLAGGFAGHSLLSPMAQSAWGHEVELHVGLGIHFNDAFLLSLITIAFGVGFFLKSEKVRNAKGSFIRLIGEGPDNFFDTFVTGMVRISTRISRILQPGSLEIYLAVTFVLIALTLLVPMIAFDELPSWPELPDLHFYEWGVLGLSLVGLFAILIAKSRLTAIVSLGIQGFSLAVIFLLFAAPDLSFTQFMVETLSVVIIALVMTKLSLAERDKRPPREVMGDAFVAILVGAGFGLLLMSATQGHFDMTLSDFYDNFSRRIAHGRNIVNVIIVDFRGFDTMGEISVVVMTALSVFTLTRGTSKWFHSKSDDAEASQDSMARKGADQ